MARTTLTRRIQFGASHRYARPEWDDARNRAVFGACAAPEPHRHDYTCDVTVTGPVDPLTGMLVDLGALDAILDAEVVRPLAGRAINDALPEFAPGRRIPTCEELAAVIAARVDAALRGGGATAHVMAVRLAEDDTLSASWTAEP